MYINKLYTLAYKRVYFLINIQAILYKQFNISDLWK